MMEFDFLMFSQETAIIDTSQGPKYASGSAINPVKLIHSSNTFMKITRTNFQTGAFSKKAFSACFLNLQKRILTHYIYLQLI